MNGSIQKKNRRNDRSNIYIEDSAAPRARHFRDPLLCAASHEAAHLVASLVVGIPITSALIRRNGSGHCRLRAGQWVRDPSNPLVDEAKGIRYAVMAMAGIAANLMDCSSDRERNEAMSCGRDDVSQLYIGLGKAKLLKKSQRNYSEELCMVLQAALAVLVDCKRLHRTIEKRLIATLRLSKEEIYSIARSSNELRRCRLKWGRGLDLTLVDDIAARKSSSIARESGFKTVPKAA